MGSSKTVTAVELLVRQMEAEGVSYVFGIPGGPLMPLYEAIFSRKKIQPILTKHEEGAAFMAEGYARVSGKLGVCCATTGPGATNALTGIACAYSDSTPVLLLTAQVGTAAFGKGALQESTVHGVDLVSIFSPITKLSVMIPTAEKMGEMTRRALRTAQSGRPGPIHLNIPADIAKHPVPLEVFPPMNYRGGKPAPTIMDVVRVAELIFHAKRPAILAGHGIECAKAWEELLDFAELTGIPVATTPKGKSSFPENHALSLGVFGFAGHQKATDYLLSGDVDVLIVIGSSLGDWQTNSWDPRLTPSVALIQIDIDPMEIGKNYPVDVGINADASETLKALILCIRSSGKMLKKPALPLETKEQTAFQEIDHGTEGNGIHPAMVVEAMQNRLPADTILFVDNGSCINWGVHCYLAQTPGAFQIGLGLAAMGHAVAAAIGGKLAAPDRPVVALVGDAAFAMNGMEIHTAAEYKIPVTWIVLNNGGHGLVHLGEQHQFDSKFDISSFRKSIDFCKMAESLGVKSYRAETVEDFDAALKGALAMNTPCLIDVQVDIDVLPPGMKQRFDMLNKSYAGERYTAPIGHHHHHH
uniref:BbmA n=1 Tax=Brevibacillus TaxID=55080 RepID=A0ABF7PQ46_9BACL